MELVYACGQWYSLPLPFLTRPHSLVLSLSLPHPRPCRLVLNSLIGGGVALAGPCPLHFPRK